MKDFNKNFAERLKKALDGRSQVAVSKRIGYSQAVISKYLAGKIPDQFEFLEKLAKEYSLDLNQLITGNSFKNNEHQRIFRENFLKKISGLVDKFIFEEPIDLKK